jgi:biotin transport system substrate-specific component
MNDQAQIQEFPAAALPTVASGLRNLFIVLAGSAVVAVSAHIALPLYFSPRLAAATLAAYLAEGAAGLPVFTPTNLAMPGLAHLLGPTGGYLVAYPFAVYAIAGMWRSSKHTLQWALLSAGAGNLIILCFGAVWLSVLTHASVNTVLSQAVIPFLPGDALKVVVAAALGFEWYRNRPARTNV